MASDPWRLRRIFSRSDHERRWKIYASCWGIGSGRAGFRTDATRIAALGGGGGDRRRLIGCNRRGTGRRISTGAGLDDVHAGPQYDRRAHQPKRLNTVSVFPGKTVDIVVYGDNPGFWTFHDHDVRRVMNNGIYPGGMLTLLEYEDMGDVPYVPSIAINE